MNSASTAELGSDSADSADSVKTGLDAFLTWAEERGTPVSPRAAHAVLTLLALRGARRRAGFPEPTAELATTVLHQDLPAFAAASREELADYPAVLVALADRTHEARLLNAKARARMVAGIEANAAAFFERMTDPGRLTWLRLYAGLMRADHVRPNDPDAVAGWLRDFADRPAGERRAAVARGPAECCPLGEWVLVNDLFKAMIKGGHDPVVSRGTSIWKLYVGDPEYGGLGYGGHHEWPVLLGRYTLAVLFEYA